MRVMLLTADRKTARSYTETAERTGIVRLCCLKNTAQVLERLFRDPFDALLSDDPTILLPQIRNCPVRWPAQTFLLTEKPIGTIHVPDCLTFCFSKDSEPKDVLSRIAQFPGHEKRVNSADTVISRFLQYAGVPVFMNGFSYLGVALRLMLSQNVPPEGGLLGVVYHIVSMMTGVSAYVTEHAIRNAVDAAWIRADTVVLEKLFGYTVRSDRGAPSNAAFLFRAADYIRLTEEGNSYDTGRNV